MTPLLWSAVLLGFVLGLRHALDPDHVVAVSTIVSGEANWRRSSLIGSYWGLGHAASLLSLGGIIVAFRINITDLFASRLEIVVAVMLIGLGLYAIRAARVGLRVHVHAPRHAHPFWYGLRPFAVGLVHGVAGSGGLALLVMATARTAAEGFLYMAALAFGAMVGMGLLSALLTLRMAALSARYELLPVRFQYLSGLGSMAFGLWLFAEHLVEFL